MDLAQPDITLLKFLARYSVIDIDGIRTIYSPYGGKRYYEDRISKLRSKGVKLISIRNRQSDYVLLTHGRQALAEMGIKNIMWYSGSHKSLGRLEAVSRLAVLLIQSGLDVLADFPVSQDSYPSFIPSNIIKSMIGGIDRQSRFAGMLYTAGSSYAVYDLGDGSRMWQPLSESSLFKEGLRESFYPDGMLMLTEDRYLDDIMRRMIISDTYDRCYKNKNNRSKKQPVRLLPGYKRCCIAGKKDAALMLKLLSDKGWKKHLQLDLFPGADLLHGSSIEPDICFNDCNVYLFADNDILRAKLLRQYFDVCPEEKAIHIFCMENALPFFTELFSKNYIVPLNKIKMERILAQGGEIQ